MQGTPNTCPHGTREKMEPEPEKVHLWVQAAWPRPAWFAVSIKLRPVETKGGGWEGKVRRVKETRWERQRENRTEIEGKERRWVRKTAVGGGEEGRKDTGVRGSLWRTEEMDVLPEPLRQGGRGLWVAPPPLYLVTSARGNYLPSTLLPTLVVIENLFSCLLLLVCLSLSLCLPSFLLSSQHASSFSSLPPLSARVHLCLCIYMWFFYSNKMSTKS